MPISTTIHTSLNASASRASAFYLASSAHPVSFVASRASVSIFYHVSFVARRQNLQKFEKVLYSFLFSFLFFIFDSDRESPRFSSCIYVFLPLCIGHRVDRINPIRPYLITTIQPFSRKVNENLHSRSTFFMPVLFMPHITADAVASFCVAGEDGGGGNGKGRSPFPTVTARPHSTAPPLPHNKRKSRWKPLLAMKRIAFWRGKPSIRSTSPRRCLRYRPPPQQSRRHPCPCQARACPPRPSPRNRGETHDSDACPTAAATEPPATGQATPLPVPSTGMPPCPFPRHRDRTHDPKSTPLKKKPQPATQKHPAPNHTKP